jgi:hypothetical protein
MMLSQRLLDLGALGRRRTGLEGRNQGTLNEVSKFQDSREFTIGAFDALEPGNQCALGSCQPICSFVCHRARAGNGGQEGQSRHD